MKINIVGTTATGKSTFGRKLAAKMGIPFLEMDAIFWRPNWQEPSDEEFFPKLENALAAHSWVLDGNYTRTIPIKWKHIDTVIWLDYSFKTTITQSVLRAFKRAYSKTELWPETGNYETFGKMFSKQSIIWWCIKNYSKNKKKYKRIMENPTYSHIKFVRLTSHEEAQAYIDSQ